jgi:hypothetical protein
MLIQRESLGQGKSQLGGRHSLGVHSYKSLPESI